MVDLLVLLLRALLVFSGGPVGRVFAVLGVIVVLRFLLGAGTRGARSG